MWQYGSSYGSSHGSSHNRSCSSRKSTPVKQSKFKIKLFSATGTIINSWTGTAIRHENGVCKFYNEETGTIVQIIGTIVIE